MINSLDLEISDFLIPKLKEFRERNEVPFRRKSFKETQFILQRIIEAFDLYTKSCSEALPPKKKTAEKIDKGLQLFAKYFNQLWL